MASAGGGTINLAATGTANYALELPASSPDAHTAFRRTFKKLTHFALETLACDSFTVTSGSYTNVDIPRVGDVVYALYVQLALPGLANVIYPSVASTNAAATGQYYEVVHTAAMKTAIAGMGGNAIVDPTPEGAVFPYACTPRWAPALALIKSVQLIVGSSVVDTLSTVVMSVWKELTDAWAWKETWGDYDTVEESILHSKKMQLYYVDLPFAFFLSPPGEKGGNALSLITLSFHSVRLAIQPQALSACVVGYADGSSTTPLVDNDGSADQSHLVTTIVRDGQSVDTAAAQSTGLANGRLALVSSSTTSVNTLAFSDLKWQVLVSFAYLSDDERVLYSDASFETVITCWDTQETTYSSSSMGTIDISLPFAHPTAAIFVVAQSQHKLLASTTQGAQSATTQFRNGHFDWAGVTEPVTGVPLPAILAASIELNSLRLNSGGPATIGANMLHESYHRKLMMNQHLTHPPMHTKGSMSGRKYVYCFSFSLSPLGPDPLQAVGFANLARIDSTKIKLQLDDQLFADNSAASAGGENLSNNRVSIFVLAYSYNIFRYIMGLGGKALV